MNARGPRGIHTGLVTPETAFSSFSKNISEQQTPTELCRSFYACWRFILSRACRQRPVLQRSHTAHKKQTLRSIVQALDAHRCALNLKQG